LAACASSEDPFRCKDFGPFDLNFELIEYNDILALEDQLKSYPNVIPDNNFQIVAYMLETVQGEKGVIVPSDDYLQKVRDLCTKYNVLMIADEV
jgi:ornithine--oxo-acid transaminase